VFNVYFYYVSCGFCPVAVLGAEPLWLWSTARLPAASALRQALPAAT